MKIAVLSLCLALSGLSLVVVEALIPRATTTATNTHNRVKITDKKKNDLLTTWKTASANVMAAATIAAAAATTTTTVLVPSAADATTMTASSPLLMPTTMTTMMQTSPTISAIPMTSSSTMVSEKVIREGVYGEYEMEVPQQVYDDARSTYKTAKETKSKKGKYTALLAILIVGSFIIPMAQYFWYVRDDDSTDKFFGQEQQQVEEPPPKKKGWF